MARNILITSALPYANGPIHLGHLVEYIQSDIWARFQRMNNHQCYYICADDAHGTPIMLSAEKAKMTPEELIEQIHQEHRQDFADFNISFDHYDTTHSDTNHTLCKAIYNTLNDNKHIEQRNITQLYDPLKAMFLPDRFIKGQCPVCHRDEQYGDACEACGAIYTPVELKNAYSTLSGAKPINKTSLHYFLKLANFEKMLTHWIRSGHLQSEVGNKLDEWLQTGLRDWDISRDAPYFGFKIPDIQDKYFYVWLDAPIGYMASFKNFCAKNPHIHFDDYWGKDAKTELYHFIGKDIIYFHALFWPAILHGSGFRTPSAVFAHGFLTVNGEKMSKTRGSFITAKTYLQHLHNPEYLRYYLATKMGAGIDDLDLNLDDFFKRVNSDLVGKLVNIASRSARFIHQYFFGQLSEQLPDSPLYRDAVAARKTIANYYETRQYNKAMRTIMALADQTNRYIDQQRPWVAIKQSENKAWVQETCSIAINVFRVLVCYLKPVLPKLASDSEVFLNCEPLHWETLSPLQAHTINPFTPLITRIEKNQIDQMIKASQSTLAATTDTHHTIEPIDHEITVDDFAKLDLRIAKIIKAETIDGADCLLRLTLDIGNDTRQILAGIKTAYQPQTLEGRLTVIIANLTPRKMRFGVSNGMLLAAGNNENIFLLSPDQGAQPGMRIK